MKALLAIGLVALLAVAVGWNSRAARNAPAESPAESPTGSRAEPATDPSALAEVRGMTISCQTNGREWALAGFATELDRLAELGVNWVAIHPYARIQADGRVTWRTWESDAPPELVTNPIRRAHERGFGILVKPHIGYWGSPFDWRGAIDFEDGSARALFFETYTQWIVAVARAARDADAFCVGTEIDRLAGPRDEAAWRTLIAAVRAETPALLSYAANWTDFERVPFWDALDAVGVQAYFPLTDVPEPSPDEIAAGWREPLARLRALHAETGKPVVFTELGYDAALTAAREPWVGKPWHGFGRHAEIELDPVAQELQERCYDVALGLLSAERDWLRGAFLWKWFVGPAPGEDFLVDTPGVHAVLRARWRRE